MALETPRNTRVFLTRDGRMLPTFRRIAGKPAVASAAGSMRVPEGLRGQGAAQNCSFKANWMLRGPPLLNSGESNPPLDMFALSCDSPNELPAVSRLLPLAAGEAKLA
jgi:hypothetical protein